MKKFKYIFALMAVALGFTSASAYEMETQSPYTYDFNLSGYSDAATNLEHTWAPPGWSHIVDYYSLWGTVYYVSYDYMQTSGVDGSGAIRVGSQTLGSEWYGSKTAKDVLVTPFVSGRVSLQVKANAYGGTIQFYNISGTGKNLAVDTLITDTTMTGPLDVNSDNYITVSFDAGATPRHIGIRADQVFIDNFTAATGSIELRPALKINGVKQISNTNVDADADGNFDVHFKASVTNTGLADLHPGDAGYSLSLVNYGDGEEIKNIPITFTLAQNTTDSVDVQATLNMSRYTEGHTWNFQLRENIDSTVAVAGEVSPTAYVARFILRELGSNSDLKDSASIAYGMRAKAETRQFTITNTGAKTLNITSITAPEGYTVLPETAFTVPGHKTDTITIRQDNLVQGNKSGMVVFKMDELNDFHLNVSGTVIDSTKWFVDFENNEIPVNMIQEGGNWSTASYPSDINLGGNKYCLYQDQYGNPSDHLISPKLHVGAGESLSFMASKFNNSSFFNVYYSTDRHHWQLAQTISSGDTIPEEFRFTDETAPSNWAYQTNYQFKTFTIDNIPAGDVYVAFAGTWFYLDNLYGFTEVPVNHDFALSSVSLPKDLSVNQASKFSVSVQNPTAKAETAGSYTVKMSIGSQSYETEGTAISAGGSASFDFNVTPHYAGTLPVYAVIETADGETFTSDTAQVVVAAESASAVHQVGTPDAGSAGGWGIIKTYDKKSQAVAVYTPEQINLPAGTKLRGLTIRGYNNSPVDGEVEFYLRSTDKTSLSTSDAETEIKDTANFTRAYAGPFTLASAGRGTSDWNPTMLEAGDIVHVTFAEPFTYDGGNLEVASNSSVSSYRKAVYEATNISGQSAGRSNDSYLPSFFSSINLPVIYFDVDLTPTTLIGTVTSAATSEPVEGVEVKLVSGDVEYADTTGTDGKYTISVMQSGLNYQLQANKPGYTPKYIDNVSVANDTTINVSLADANGFFVLGSKLPATGMVNSVYSASVNALNTEASAIDSAAYTATLYFGDEAMAVAKEGAPKVESGDKADFNFVFTPHKAGTFDAYVKFEYGDKVSTSDTVSVTVSDEQATKEVTINTYTRGSNLSPYTFYYSNSQSEVLYKAAQIGLAPGSKITKITFKGYATDVRSSFAPSLTAYIANTDADTIASVGNVLADTTTMTCLARDTALVEFQSGRSFGTSSEPVDLVTFNIPDGFVYTGGNIRMVFDMTSDSYTGAYFAADENVDPSQTVYRYNDSRSTMLDNNFAQSNFGQPVAYLEVVTEGSVSGKVVNSRGEGISGAVVNLNSGDVLYTDTTDTEGNYAVSVKQLDKTYDATVSAAGYYAKQYATAFSFADSTSIVFNDTLTHIVAAKGTVKAISNKADAVAAPLAGATVAISDATGATVATLTTAADGTFAADSLVENKAYTFKFSAAGYNDSIVNVTAGFDTLQVNATLRSQYISAAGTVKAVNLNSDNTTATTPLAGATVTISDAEGNVVATATTDAEGAYSVDSLLEKTTYTFVFSAAGYKDSTATVEAQSADLTVNATLYSDEVLGIDGVSSHVRTATGNVYTLNGQLVGRNADLKALPRGVYIIDGRKVTVK